jgi:hypothetical protein
MSERGMPYRSAAPPPGCGECRARLLRPGDALIDSAGEVVLCAACFERRQLGDAVRDASSAIRDERFRRLAGWSLAVLAYVLLVAGWAR